MGTQISDATETAAPPSATAAPVPLLLGTQMLFNVGFYAVVPFLAVVLSGDFGAGAATVGLVLGLRTLAQQGMFLVGGALADRFGARTMILAGCAVRIAGFLSLSASLWPSQPQLWLFIAGTVLTGLGGALFSPGLSMLVADADQGTPRRITLFAWLTITGEAGAVIGPLAGALLLPAGFAVVAVGGAVFFLLIAGMLAWQVPRPPIAAHPRARRTAPGLPALRHPAFTGFAALHAVDLVAYNQLYLTLPLELARAGGGVEIVGAMFAWASLLTLTLQLPIAAWCARVGPLTALRTGYLAEAAGFALPAATACTPLPAAVRVAVVGMAVTLIIAGHLAANPTAMTLVPRFAAGRPTGTYFGLLATAGGIAVLLANLTAGRLVDAAPAASGAPLAWLFLAALPIVSAVAVGRMLAREHAAGR